LVNPQSTIFLSESNLIRSFGTISITNSGKGVEFQDVPQIPVHLLNPRPPPQFVFTDSSVGVKIEGMTADSGYVLELRTVSGIDAIYLGR
jgi:hypothetical protein